MKLVFFCLFFTQLAFSKPIPGHWLHEKEEIEKVFDKAKKENKLILLFWGAEWNPSSNRLRHVIMNQAGILEYINDPKKRKFIPVYLDGDSLNAQKYADEFKVIDYPTLIILDSRKQELFRLDPTLNLDDMRFALEQISYSNHIKRLYSQARSYKGLTPKQWKLLAAYSWEQDLHNILGESKQRKVSSLGRLFDKSAKLSKSIHYHFGLIYLHQAALHSIGISQKNRKRLQVIWEDLFVSRKYLYKHLDLFAYDYYPMRLLLYDNKPKNKSEINLIQSGSGIISHIQAARLFYQEHNKHNGKIIKAVFEIIQGELSPLKYTDQSFSYAVNSSIFLHLTSQNYQEAKKYVNIALNKLPSKFYYMSYLSVIYDKMQKPKLSLEWAEKAWGETTGRSTKIEQSVRYLEKLITTTRNFKKLPAPLEYILEQTAQNPDLLKGRGEMFLKRLNKSLRSLTRTRTNDLKSKGKAFCFESKLQCSDTIELIFSRTMR